MKNRTCLPCTACCEGWFSSRHIEMSPGNPCQHCTSQGCAIFDRRPVDPCRKFECAWLMAESPLPRRMRPDRCGAIVLLDRQFRGWDVIMATPTGWKIPPKTLDWLMAFAKKRSVPLVFIENLHEHGRYTRFKRSGYGPLAFLEAVRDPDVPLDIREI